MLHIAMSHWSMDWHKYPKSRTSIRIRPPETLDSIKCYTFPGLGGKTLDILLHNSTLQFFCMYILHTIYTFMFMYIHVHTRSWFYETVWTCTYMSVPCSDTYVPFYLFLSRWSGFQMLRDMDSNHHDSDDHDSDLLEREVSQSHASWLGIPGRLPAWVTLAQWLCLMIVLTYRDTGLY